MQLPHLIPAPQRRVVLDTFLGLDRRAAVAPGAFADMRNLSALQAPLLSTRPRRGLVRTLESPGGLIAKDALITVEAGTLCVNGLPTALTGLAPGEKQLVSMGARVLVFPDKAYYNTADPADFGSLEADWSYQGAVEYCLCDRDGNPWEDPQLSDTEPEGPENGDLWLDSAGGGRVLRQYSAAQLCWVELGTVYTRLRFQSCGQLPRLFSALDGVRLEGAYFDGLNGDKILYALGGGPEERDWLVLVGLIDAALTRESDSVRITRRLPDMDFVCECGNRLWGCRYGLSEGRVLNEIYASALGDAKNFRQYLGLSTDSWTASLGSDGPFTGAIAYLGRPCFFKEDRIHLVTVSAAGAHRLDELSCRGVQRGSEKSLCLVGETLFYKARDTVCAWQGGFPADLGAALGTERRDQAAAGCLDGRYYLSQHAPGGWELLVYDPASSLWHREDSLHALAFAALEGELYAIDADTGALLALKGTRGEPEAELPWMAQTGPLRYTAPDKQYLARTDLTLWMERGGSLTLYLRYDGAGDWKRAASLENVGEGSFTLPIRPRRCDSLELRLEGRGAMRLYALSQILERGSDA